MYLQLDPKRRFRGNHLSNKEIGNNELIGNESIKTGVVDIEAQPKR